MFDELYSLDKTPEETKRSQIFTEGDYRRFCAIFYLQSRRLLADALFIMQREKRKRMMPRHMLTAAVLNGIIPRAKISDSMLSKERVRELD